MARKLRIEYEGAIYHVTCRLVGSWREGDRELFRDDRDRWRFLESLAERVELYGARLHQYVLMANHFHLVLETPQPNCSAFMQSLLTSYTVYFNLRHGRHGHLFDGRYKAKLVEGDRYLLALSRYVHLNPVRVCELDMLPERRKVLNSYYWSSYLQYVGRRKKLDAVTFEPTLALVSRSRGAGLRYRKFVEQGLDVDWDEHGLGEDAPLSIGSREFRDGVQEKYAELVASTAHPEDVAFRRAESTLPPEIVLGIVAGVLGCEASLFSQRRHGTPERPFAAYFLTRFAGLSRRCAATCVGATTGAAVTQQISRYLRLVAENRSLRKLAASCEAALREASDAQG